MKPVKSDNSTRAIEQDLRSLECRIDELIQVCARLKEENTLLRSQNAKLASERAELAKKTELASTRVESMIMRFKSMEYDA